MQFPRLEPCAHSAPKKAHRCPIKERRLMPKRSTGVANERANGGAGKGKPGGNQDSAAGRGGHREEAMTGENPNRDIAGKKRSPNDPSAKNHEHQRPPKQRLLRERGAAEHGSGVK